MAVKTTRLDRLISETDWMKQLKNVVGPIQDEIIQFQFLPKSTMTDLSTESYDLHCPESKLLITLLCLTPSRRFPILSSHVWMEAVYNNKLHIQWRKCVIC